MRNDNGSMVCARNTSPIMEGGDSMQVFTAKNPKQLDLCLKLLYSERVTFSVRVRESTKKKIEYVITADADELKVEELMEKYRILIS